MRMGIAVLFCAQLTVQAQPPDTLWTKHYPLTGEPWDFVNTSDRGFIVAEKDFDTNDATLTKLDSLGNVEWRNVYVVDNRTTIYSVAEFANGYAAVGHQFGFPHHFDFSTYSICVDYNGDTLWTREFNLDSLNDRLQDIVALSDGFMCVGEAGYVGNASAGGDILIMRLTLQGDTLWTRRYGTSLPDQAYDVFQVSEGQFLVTGTVGDPDAINQQFTSAFVLLINSDGDSLWMRAYGGDEYILCEEAEPDGDGGFILTGVARSESWGTGDIFVVRGDSQGNILWERRLGGDFNQVGRSICENPGGGYTIIGGQGQTDSVGARPYVLRLNGNGDSLWSATYAGPWGGTTQIIGTGGVVQSNGSYTILGMQYQEDELLQGMLLIQTCPEALSAGREPASSTVTLGLESYPNPFNASLTVRYLIEQVSSAELHVYDIQGRLVASRFFGTRTPGAYLTTISNSSFASGSYFLALRIDGNTRTIRVICLK